MTFSNRFRARTNGGERRWNVSTGRKILGKFWLPALSISCVVDRWNIYCQDTYGRVCRIHQNSRVWTYSSNQNENNFERRIYSQSKKYSPEKRNAVFFFFFLKSADGHTRDIQSSIDPNVGNASPSSRYDEIISLRELSESDALEVEGVLVLAATCT